MVLTDARVKAVCADCAQRVATYVRENGGTPLIWRLELPNPSRAEGLQRSGSEELAELTGLEKRLNAARKGEARGYVVRRPSRGLMKHDGVAQLRARLFPE
jgi:hypothetical protein